MEIILLWLWRMRMARNENSRKYKQFVRALREFARETDMPLHLAESALFVAHDEGVTAFVSKDSLTKRAGRIMTPDFLKGLTDRMNRTMIASNTKGIFSIQLDYERWGGSNSGFGKLTPMSLPEKTPDEGVTN